MNRLSQKPILSICIPNYGRPKFLAKNLQVIAKQNTPKVEVVVVDDASPNDICHVINDFKKRYPQVNLRFKKHSSNQGFDKNVLSVIHFARGQYCWLLSNDDQVLPGAINKVLKTIDKNQNLSLILVNYQRFDQIIKRVTSDKMISINEDRVYNNASDFFFDQTPGSYFKYLGLNCLTMSVDIFNRNYWLKAAKSLSRYMGHNFIHFFVIASIIQSHPSIYFISSPKLRYTANNHRIWSNPIWHDIRRYFLDHLLDLGYDQKRVLALKKELKKDEINEKLFLLSQRSPKLYHLLFPYIRRVRRLMGHHI